MFVISCTPKTIIEERIVYQNVTVEKIMLITEEKIVYKETECKNITVVNDTEPKMDVTNRTPCDTRFFSLLKQLKICESREGHYFNNTECEDKLVRCNEKIGELNSSYNTSRCYYVD